MKTEITYAGTGLLILGGIWYLFDKAGLIGMVNTAANTVKSGIENVAESVGQTVYLAPDEYVDMIIDYCSTKGYSYEQMKHVIDEGQVLFPFNMAVLLPDQITAQDYVNLMFSWVSDVTGADVMQYFGNSHIGGGKISTETEFAYAWEWAVTQYESIVSYISENALHDKTITIGAI